MVSICGFVLFTPLIIHTPVPLMGCTPAAIDLCILGDELQLNIERQCATSFDSGCASSAAILFVKWVQRGTAEMERGQSRPHLNVCLLCTH